MFLKCLDIVGFKSFADKTHIDFADGITSLLGPNGCGKSNVVDAIKWVLAENKSKNLRAESMADVIFNGTEQRPALSVAEVTLTIANENGLLPMQESEIAIKRRIYRSGENEYFINGEQSTATKVRQLFMDTGVGKAAYSVMEQGEIDQILSSKPEDRRYLFEEAAGISRSKADVIEAERELERTKANLAQIEIGLAETKRNYETLKAQSDKTTKYRKLQDDKFNYELDIQLLRLKDFEQNKARNDENRKLAEKKRDEADRDIKEIYSTLNENTEKVSKLQEQVTVKTQEQIRIGAEYNGKQQLLKQLHDQQSQIKEKIGQIENRIKNIEERINKKEKTIASKTKLLAKKEKIIVDAGYDLNDRESIKQNSQMFWIMFDIDNLKEDLVRLPKEIEELKKRITELEDEVVQLANGENY